ncbi:MAG: UvrD-helicase domain-containing protein [Steroidobacteraceae bacterium]
MSTDPFEVAKDGAARRHAVAASGSVLVQAPAGSGKTTLLVQRYLSLLASCDAPERILALTFTNRAAEEMRDRVTEALRTAPLAACPPSMNRQTWSLAVSAARHLQARQIDVERQPSRLRIETIDAFNAWLAAQLPITAGAGGRLNTVENAAPMYEEAARRALAHDGADPFGWAVERLLALDDQRWRRLVELIAEMLRSRDRWLPLLVGRLQAASSLDEEQLHQVRRRFDEDLELLVTRTLRSAYETLGGERIAALAPLLHAAALRIDDERSDIAEWRIEEGPLRPEATQVGRWRGMAALCLTNGSMLRKRLTKAEGFPAQCAEKSPMLELLAELADIPEALGALREVRTLPPPKYSDENWERVRDVAQVLVLAAAELERVFRERGAVDFPAVSMAALRALGTPMAPTDLNLRLDYRLQHLLLDEFQDTSSAQLDMVRLVTAGWQRGDGRSVFCVGDPMQSIYGFRQAEVRAFLELAEDGIGDLRFDVERLSSNFRSDRRVVDWINACFARILPQSDDRERGAIAFRPSDSAVQSSAAAEPSVTIRSYGTRGAEALAIAELIEARRGQHPEWRIAVLVRARSYARNIASCLRTRGVAFRAVDLEPLQDRDAVRDLVMLVRALLHLGDRTAWLAVLRAPWVGLTLADLLIVARAAPAVWDALREDAVLGRLSDEGRVRCMRLRAVLEAAFRVQSHGTIVRWVERTWLGIGGPSCVADQSELDYIRAVFARLRELEQRGLPDAADLADGFADLFADTGGASAVEIMTIHKAKGLEFDMVVLPALDRHPGSNRDQLLLMHQFARTSRDGMVMAARPAVGADQDRLFEFLRRRDQEAAALESERLLYVACTRAKWQLHLTATIEPLEEDSDEGSAEPDSARRWKPRVGSLLAVLWPTVGLDFTAAVRSPAIDPPSAADGPVMRGGPLRRVPRGWSPANLFAQMGAAPAVPLAPRAETPVFDWAGETARRVGSLVHAELQVMDIERMNEGAVRASDEHFRRWLALHGVPEEMLKDASARVMNALTAVQGDPRGRWILQRRGGRDDVREFAVSGQWRGELVRAVFDRSFIDERGTRWVIDYKTSQHSGGSLAEFLDREVDRYRPQLQRYALLARKLGPEPVRVGLYFPLMRAWREWSPEN